MSTPQRRGGIALALAFVLALTAFIWGGGDAQGTNTPGSTSTTEGTEGEEECSRSWSIAQADNGNNRWFAEGIEQIREAETEAEAREAAKTWLDQVKRVPELLSGAAAYFLDKEVDAATLVDGNCASTKAKQLTAEIELALAEAEVTSEDAPSDGYNSGVNADGQVVVAERAGITGDRSAVKVVLKDGTTLWLMARCGNPVVKVPPKIPEGPTDQEVPPTQQQPTPTTSPPTTAPPTTTTTAKPPLLGPDGEQPCPGHNACQTAEDPGRTEGAPEEEPPPEPAPPPAGSEEEEAIEQHDPPEEPEPEVEDDPPTQGTTPPPPP